ncbi:MAG: hypothetical protein RI964_3030 [Pseudomonadota bacterium]|jgi:SAM-dependent methyltransferase
MSFLALVDCREVETYCQGHIQGATCIPATELAVRMHELPKRSEPLTLCGDPQQLVQAHEFLTSKGYQITQQITWSAELHQELQLNGCLAFGAQSQRLWQPAPLITHFVQTLMPAQAIQPGVGLDIACGAGRDMVYLALHGWQMTGLDYIPGALQRANQLAAQHQVQVTTQLCDLEVGHDPFVAYATAQFDLICVVRYLHRPLFPWLKRILKPGGIFIQQTFMQGCEQFGSPRNPHFLLKPGELADVFASAEILLNEVDYLEDGRPVSAFIARVS